MRDFQKNNKFVFVSNVDILRPRGGWDGLGGKVFRLLSEHSLNIQLLQNVNPGVSLISKGVSKVLRKSGLRGSFTIFGKRRLKLVKDILEKEILSDATYLIFHGSTPWIGYKPSQKYCALLDCSFMTYMQVYHDIKRFSRSDIKRIMEAERLFFERAHKIFFTTRWALEDACKLYDLPGKNFHVIGQGPSAVGSDIYKDNYKVKNQFLFIATDFLGKGGAEVCNSFSEFLKVFPDYELVIVGQRPPEHFLEGKNIRFMGFINKSTQEGLQQLGQLYSETKALLMMTRKDIAPLVVIEAGLSGCPTIANKVAGLSEMINDKRTGLLIDSTEKDLLQAMHYMAALPEADMQEMRAAVKSFSSTSFSWDTIINNIIQHIYKP